MSNLNLYNSTSGKWEEIKIDTRLSVLKNTVTLTANTYWVFIGITDYNPADDTLFVVKDGKVLTENVDYTFNTASLKIFSFDGSDWSKNSVFNFSVWKNVDRTLPSADGSLLQNGSVTDVKLAMPITPALTDKDGITYSSLANRLLQIDTNIKNSQKSTPYVFVKEEDVVNLGQTTEDWTNAIQNALNAYPQFKMVVLPMKTCRITRMLEVPVGTSLVGYGNASIILADFGYWQNTDYRAMHLKTVEGINYDDKTFNQVFENFTITGKGNEAKVTTGIDISTTSSISYTVAVNYSLLSAHFRNIMINRFDTGLNIVESWGCTYDSLNIYGCRIGLKIVGKSVNNTFNKLNITNGTDYTSSTDKSYGIFIDSKFTYTDGEGRPEGLLFSNCIIYGGNTSLVANRGLLVKFNDCIFDGADEDAVSILGIDGLTIRGSYIYTSGIGHCGVKLQEIAVSDNKTEISDCYFMGITSTGSSTQYGIYYYSDSVIRNNVLISGNKISGFSDAMYFNRLNSSKIINNYGHSNRGAFIYCQSDCGNSIIDGNSSDDNYPILKLHPTTSYLLSIGKNSSPITRTYFASFTTMRAGVTTAGAANSFFSTTEDMYYRAITLIQPTANLGYTWVQPNTSNVDAIINCSIAPTVDTKIFYKTIAVPYAGEN